VSHLFLTLFERRPHRLSGRKRAAEKIGVHFTAMALSILAFTASASVDKAETQRLLEVYRGNDKLAQKKDAERLTYWAVEEQEIYARINTLLLEQYTLDTKGREHVDYLAWLAKGLAASGDEQYRGTLQEVASGAKQGKLRKYASIAVESLDTHKRWNALINKPIPPGLDLPGFQQRNYYNMLIAPDMELVRIGAKRISFEAISSPVLAATLSDRILALHESADDPLDVDTLAWLLKALATCGGAEYRDTFTAVADGSGKGKIRKYAKKYAANL